ncbi:MAG: DUF4340 domain-containing protein [Anaerolineae bacterium]|nr:DUF4340 domain-containing protein [Anaerolineae bacterium]
MRLDRNTLILIGVCAIVIIAVIVLGGQPGAAPDVTPTAQAEGAGPLFPAIADTGTQGDIVRFEVLNNTDGSKVVMTKDDANVWTISEATNARDLATDQTQAVGAMSILASLSAIDRFESDQPLSAFGLETPFYTFTLTAKDGTTYVVKIGAQTVANPRYYALVGDTTTPIYLLPKDLVDGLISEISNPAYVPAPTPTATATSTPNPFSEVEQTATAAVEQAQFFATLTATAQGTGAPELTAEATAEATVEAAAEATAEATASP